MAAMTKKLSGYLMAAGVGYDDGTSIPEHLNMTQMKP